MHRLGVKDFDQIRSAPDTTRYENQLIVADGQRFAKSR
jgi:hypothetical protein